MVNSFCMNACNNINVQNLSFTYGAINILILSKFLEVFDSNLIQSIHLLLTKCENQIFFFQPHLMKTHKFDFYNNCYMTEMFNWQHTGKSVNTTFLFQLAKMVALFTTIIKHNIESNTYPRHNEYQSIKFAGANFHHKVRSIGPFSPAKKTQRYLNSDSKNFLFFYIVSTYTGKKIFFITPWHFFNRNYKTIFFFGLKKAWLFATVRMGLMFANKEW